MNVKEFIENNLLNKHGKLEAQRLKEKWLTKNGFTKEYLYLSENCITDSKSLYMYLNNASDKCECGAERRFIGFRDGFKEYCVKCARSKNNWMTNGKSSFDSDNIDEIIIFVKDKNGNYSTSKFKQLSDTSISSIKSSVDFLEDATLSEYLFNIENNIFSKTKCKQCKTNDVKFISASKGYSDCCSNECSAKYTKDVRAESLKKTIYTNLQNKFKSAEYDIRMFTFDEYMNDETEIKFKHIKCSHEYSYDLKYQGSVKCPKCYPIRSKKQYEINEWLSNYCSTSYNNRKLIAPKEIDILTETFGIEYDSLMFHSFGKSDLDMFNNTDVNRNHNLEKTLLVEDKGLQLFRIFSNEWENKRDIWKSIILSKLGKTNKIHARKCTIREINNKEANTFLDVNHMQGIASHSIRLGLFYKDELVSVMTFGKSRYKKDIEYELIRFCTVLNTTVVGGASKLLRYFERMYKPKSIISYANRRWSQGNLYKRLGFEFTHSTPPNYFYFKNDYDELHSRVKFQKHKLKDMLEVFNPDLSETENMFNNGYRKIYDCGNHVFIKRYS